MGREFAKVRLLTSAAIDCRRFHRLVKFAGCRRRIPEVLRLGRRSGCCSARRAGAFSAPLNAGLAGRPVAQPKKAATSRRTPKRAGAEALPPPTPGLNRNDAIEGAGDGVPIP